MTPEQAKRRWQQAKVARQRRDVELETFPVTGGTAAKTSHPMFGTSGAGTAASVRLRGLVTEPPAPAGLTVWGTHSPAPVEHVGGGYHLLACTLISQDAGWMNEAQFYIRFSIAVWLLRPDGTFSDAWVSPGNLVRPYTQGFTADAVHAPPLGEPTELSMPKLARWQEGALLSFTSFIEERQYVDDLDGFWPQYVDAPLEVPWGANVYYHIGHDGTDPVVGPALELYAGPDADFPDSGDWDVGGGVTQFDDGTVEGFEVVGPSADTNIAVYGLAYNSFRHRIWLFEKDGSQNLTLMERTTWPDSVATGNPGGLTRIAADRWVAMCALLGTDGMAAILFDAKTGTVVDTLVWDEGDRVACYFLIANLANYYAGNHLHFDGRGMFAAYWETDFTDLQHRFVRLAVDDDVLSAGQVVVWDEEENTAGFAERLVETCEGCLRIVTSWDSRRQALFERYMVKSPMVPLLSPEYLPVGMFQDQRTVPSSHPAGLMWAANVAQGDTWDLFAPIVPKLVRYPA